MSLVDRTHRSSFGSAFVDLMEAGVQWFAAFQARRARRATLESLLFAPEYRLRDIGITREQLINAIESHRK